MSFGRQLPLGGPRSLGFIGDDAPPWCGRLASLGPLASLGWQTLDDDSDPRPVYDGANVLAAFHSWWQDQADLQAMLAPCTDAGGATAGRLWHLEAPEGQDPPFAVFFLVSEAEAEPRTTGYACLLATIQVNVHAATDEQAVAIRKAIRKAVVATCRLSIDGLAARHVLPTSQMLTIGEGFLRGGKDSSMASLEIEIPYEVDYAS